MDRPGAEVVVEEAEDDAVGWRALVAAKRDLDAVTASGMSNVGKKQRALANVARGVCNAPTLLYLADMLSRSTVWKYKVKMQRRVGLEPGGKSKWGGEVQERC